MPSNKEIIEIDVDIEQFKKTNLPMNFQYDLGVPAEKTLPEFICNEVVEKVKAKVQTLTLSDSRDIDAVIKEKQRLVEFN